MRMRKLRGPHKKKSMPFENFRTKTQPVNLADLEERFDAGAEVTPATLKEKGLAKRSDPVKILARGEISKKLDVHAHAFSAAAKEKIEAAGGSCHTLEPLMLRTIANAFSVADIRKKLAFTAAMLALYRLGAYIPAPGVDVQAVKELQSNFGGSNILGFLNLFSGGSLSRLSPLRAGDHALHHRLDHPAAADRGRALAGEAAERGRGRAAEDHPVHALPDRRPRLRPVASATSSSSAPSAAKPAAQRRSATSPARRSC